MKPMYLFIVLNAIVVSVVDSQSAFSRNVFDQDLYESVIDEELCEQQLNYLVNSTMRLQFYDASAKIPSGILRGNINDFGDYHQCLSIDEIVNQMEIQGKYCVVTIPLDQESPIDWPSIPDWNITLPEIPDLNITLPPLLFEVESKTLEVVKQYDKMQQMALIMAGLRTTTNNRVERNVLPMQITAFRGMTMGVCIPKVCSSYQALDFVQNLLPFMNVTYNEYYCRLPGDKPWTAAEYVAISIFGLIALLLVISTTYDLCHTFVQKRDPKQANQLLRSFSVYTNTQRFLTFKPQPGALECLDGIRAISMLWVVIGHTFFLSLFGYLHNLQYVLNWMTTLSSIWVITAPITVDTFFLLSGILVVYSIVGKINRNLFVRSLPLFYLNRLLRMFPLLAVVIILQAGILHHVADGPFWSNVALSTQHCRNYWWSTLLHVQNYVNPDQLCLGQTWYLSVDVQLYLVSPIVLVWMFGSRTMTWIILALALALSLVGSSLYSYLFNFSAALMAPHRLLEFEDYMQTYYVNTLARASPFVIGMAYGYLLHLWRDKKVRIPKFYVITLWLMSFLLMAFCMFSIYPVMQPDHTAQAFDNFLNAYMRAIWGLALGWLVLACVHGYGGPINWFLSLSMWKLPARLSYAVYLVHFPIMMTVNGTWVKPHYFSTGDSFYRFMSDVSLSFVLAFALCIAVDAPFSTLQKLILNGGGRRPQKQKEDPLPDIPSIPHIPRVVIDTENKFIKTTL